MIFLTWAATLISLAILLTLSALVTPAS
jgi:hypothetical protein